MKCKKMLSVLISVCLLGCSVSVSAAEQDVSVNSDMEVSYEDDTGGADIGEGNTEVESGTVSSDESLSSEDDVDYIYGRPMSDIEVAEQEAMVPELPALPEPDEPSEPVLDGSEARAGAAYSDIGLYDLRNKGIISPVKSQEVGGPCWSFATMGLAESEMMKNGIASNPDMSEEHLMYFFYNRSADPLGGTKGDKNIMNLDGYTFNTIGGNPQLAAKFLATWSGAVDESVVPYTTSGVITVDPSLEYKSDVHLQNARFIDASVDEIKNAIYTYQTPVAVNYYHASKYWNVSTGGYSCPVESSINHSVIIVGWDDGFSKANFPEASKVTSDGAWIVKNSYGSDFQADGYTYISYEDKTLSGATVMMFENTNNYDNNYQYDGSSVSSSVGVPVGASHANIFTAKGDEDIKAFGILLSSANVDLSVDVYTGLKDGSDPTSGTKAISDHRVSTSHSGYYTFNLPKSVRVMKGSKFGIVVTNVSGESKSFSLGITPSSTTSWLLFQEGVEKSQSFYKSKSSTAWRDMVDSYVSDGRPANARIKVFTKNVNTSVTDPTIVPPVTEPPTTPAVSVAKPVISKAVAGVTSIKINWSKAKNATSYEVYRKSGNKVTLLGKTKGTSYTHKGLTPGRSYTYCVRGLSGSTKSAYSVSKIAITKPSRPTKVALKKKGATKATLSFVKSSGASEYYVYAYNTKTKKYSVAYKIKGKKLYQYKNKKYRKVGPVKVSKSKLQCVLPKVSKSSKIRYCVRAYAGIEGLRSCSAYSNKAAVRR